jgi:hypothetical protein
VTLLSLKRMLAAGTLWILPQQVNVTGSGPSKISGSKPGIYMAAPSNQIDSLHSGHTAVAIIWQVVCATSQDNLLVRQDHTQEPLGSITPWEKLHRMLHIYGCFHPVLEPKIILIEVGLTLFEQSLRLLRWDIGR